MFIQTEATPNPRTLKFLPGRVVLESGTANFTDLKQAEPSPLARRLFTVEGINGVFLGADFISVSCEEGQEWPTLKPAILAAIMEHYDSGEPIMEKSDGKDASFVAEKTGSSQDDAVVSHIKDLLDTRIRPAVAMDGGDITFRSYEEGIVYLEMRGACASCPSSTATLKAGIENMLRHYIPEIREVRAVA